MGEKETVWDVVCIGQAVLDCIVRGREENPHRKRVYRAESITLNTGGDAVNESIVLAGLGRRVRLVCGLGDDPAGRLILDEVRRRGVDTEKVTVSGKLCTPVANLMVEKNGSRSSVNSSATMLEGYTPEAEVVKEARVVSLASLFRAPLDQREVICDLVRAAKAEGAIVCADTKLPTWRQVDLRDLEEVLPLIDYLFPNENEGAYYTGEKEYRAMARRICEMGVKHVVIKAGEKGCVACAGGECFEMGSRAVQAVDSTGAGDSFVAGFISALLDGRSFYECCERGTDCAARCVRQVGTTAWLEEMP